MKTATINVYRPHGQHSKVASVYYRNGLLHTAHFGNTTLHGSTQGLINACKAWAECNGFSHYRVIITND